MRVLELGRISINLDSTPLSKDDFYAKYTGKVPNIAEAYKEYSKKVDIPKEKKRRSKKASE